MWLPTSASIVLLLFTPALLAQLPPLDPEQCLPFEPDSTVEWPEDAAYGSPPTFGPLVIADLNGDHDPDAVVLSSGIPVVLWNIALFDAPRVIDFPSKPAPTGVTGLAVVPGAGDDGADGVVMTDSRGLFLVTWSNDEVWGLDDFNDPTILSGSAWANAGPIQAIDLDYNGSVEFLGVAADRRSILAYYPATMTNLTVPLTYDILDVVGANWNHAGRRELCALTVQGLRIYTTSGALFASVSHAATSGCITRVRSNAATSNLDELLAWTRPASAGGSELVVLAHQHNEAARALDFDFCGDTVGITPVALVAGNYDADANGNDELVLVHGGQSAVVLINQGVSAQHFVTNDPAEYDIVPLSEAPLDAGSVGIPAFAQVDPEEGVNPDDLVFPVSATEKVHVFLRLPYYRNRVTTGAPPTSADIFEEETEYHPGSAGTLHIAFHLLPRYSDYDSVEVTIWHQGVEGGDLTPLAVSYTTHLLDGVVPRPEYQYVTVPYPFPAGNCWIGEGPCFYTELRFTKGAVTRSRYFTAGFRLQDCEQTTTPPTCPYLTLQGIPGAGFVLKIDANLPPLRTSIGNNLIGVYIPMSSQPPFDDGLDPPSRPEQDDGENAHVYENPLPE